MIDKCHFELFTPSKRFTGNLKRISLQWMLDCCIDSHIKYLSYSIVPSLFEYHKYP